MEKLFLRHSGRRNTTVPINRSMTVGYVVKANHSMYENTFTVTAN